MSVQFGRWSFDGKPVDPDHVERAKAFIAPYGPDYEGSYSRNDISLVYRAFHTTKESRREMQPYITASGAVITWDGRLDNRAELVRSFSDALAGGSTDVSIVAAAYEQWGTDRFSRLIGDWALSIWRPADRSLILAKDPIGTRHLFYSLDKDQVTWSTILDPLVLFAGKTFALNEEYVAGWLSFFPATHLTPYCGIRSVPPSCFVRLDPDKHTIKKYWDFDPGKKIEYLTDREYEEHFRAVFSEAVRRRLRSDSPILAELSGGMDSSSIVCMADTIIAGEAAETPRLDTVSYYDDSEPNWNERPYFTKVEEKRGRTGCHIDVGSSQQAQVEFDNDSFASTPGSISRPSEATKQFEACLSAQRNHVVLSGIGGDEVMGGVPTFVPELANLLARARFRALAHQLKVWALNKRKPWFYLFFEAARGFFPPALVGVPKHRRPAPWLNPGFVKRNRVALQGYERRTKVFGPPPSFQENVSTLDVLRRQLGCSFLSAATLYEKRYPYLDRGLLEFLYAIPREQLVRPGQRRSLMRRALVGIVPDELLNRKRKAYVARGALASISAEWATLVNMSQEMASRSFGIVDSRAFAQALQQARHGHMVPVVPLMRTLGIEFWLRNLSNHYILVGVDGYHRNSLKGWAPTAISAEKN